MKHLRRFLDWFLDDSIKEAVIGDLVELYLMEKEQKSHFALIRLFVRSLGFVRGSFYRRTIRFTTISEALLRNSYAMSTRRIKRQPAQVLGGFLGLIFGILCLSTLINYLAYSYSFDSDWSQADQLHRIVMDVKMGDTERKVAVAPAALQHELGAFGVLSARLRVVDDFTLFHGKSAITTSEAYRSSPELFTLFDVNWKMQAHDKMLSEPGFFYVSERFFEQLGQLQQPHSFVDASGQPLMLGGVFEDFPSNAHFQPQVLLPLRAGEPQWMDWNWITYAAADAEQLLSIIPTLAQTYLEPQLPSSGVTVNFNIQPIGEIYFASKRDFDSALHGNREIILGLTLVACLIGILIASNYLFQLLTRVQKRNIELATRHVIGATSMQLRSVLWMESTAELATVSIAATLFLWINEQMLWLPTLEGDGYRWIFASCAALWGLGLVVIRLSDLFIVKERGGFVRYSRQSGWGRFSLLWFQFTISIGLLLCLLVVSDQVNYLTLHDPGYAKEHVIDFTVNQEAQRSLSDAVEVIKEVAGVEGVTASIQVPGDRPPVNGFAFQTKDGVQQRVMAQVWADENFFDVLEIPVITGSSLASHRRHDVVVNQQFVSNTGMLAAELVGTEIRSGEEWKGTILGVVQDIQFTSMDQLIEPMVYRYTEEGRHLLVRLHAESTDKVSDLLFALHQLDPFLVADYTLLDQVYQSNYSSYQKQQDLLALATGLAVVLCMMGLWSSILAYAIRKQKALSIHKVHGAPLLKTWQVLFKPFLWVSFTAIPAGICIAYFFGERWLSAFPYRVTWPWMSWVLMLFMTIVVLFLTLLIRSSGTWKANPTQVLRSE